MTPFFNNCAKCIALLAALLPASPGILVAGLSDLDSNSEGVVQVRLAATPDAHQNDWFDRSLLEYEQDDFAFPRIPQAYTENGTRDEWPNPLMVSAEALVTVPAGEHRLLLRSRRAARVWIDGEAILETPFPARISDGHDPVERPFIDLGPTVRFAGKGDQEKLTHWQAGAKTYRVRMDFYVGGYSGKNEMRPETGETLLAISLEGASHFEIVSPRRRIELTDEAWEVYESGLHAELDRFDRDRRRTLREKDDAYWERRHALARESVSSYMKEAQSVDSFIESRISRANEAYDPSDEALHFIENVRPLLEDKCWDCHGKQAKGGLRLDSLSAAATGGDSEIPALVAGDPDESYLLELILDEDPEFRMPPKGDALADDQVDSIREWIAAGAVWPETTITSEIEIAQQSEDWQFLRRVYLDTVGVLPTSDELETFINGKHSDKRERVIDTLLDDPRWADHWVSYWQDVLAENPTIVNPTLNNTGPFRYWIHEALQDNVPMDRFVTELILMDGSLYGGGPAGFEMASQNDVPMAAKANILSTAFLGIEMKCSRCHDAPYHDNLQKDLFGIAAMLAQKPLVVPASSSVPVDKLHTDGRKPLIEVTLPPGSEVEPHWPFYDGNEEQEQEIVDWLVNPKSKREYLAYRMTSPENPRFAKVVANRVWQRFFGRGIVEPIDDWENADPLHPELLGYLANHFVVSGYDLKALARVILNSEAYQRKSSEDPTAIRFFAAQGPRQMSAEQIVDSLFAASGKEMRVEPLTVDIAGGRPWHNAMSLGEPSRAWMFGGVANNRDRPSLVLPRAQAVIDVMTAFGWRASRQEPISYRDIPLSPLQPAILNNGTMSGWLSRLSDDHGLTQLALEAKSIETLVDDLYLRYLSRYPSVDEKQITVGYLKKGFAKRARKANTTSLSEEGPRRPELFVTWANHLVPEATEVALRQAAKAKAGDPPTQSLDSDWRERMEDVVWTLINLPETIHYP